MKRAFWFVVLVLGCYPDERETVVDVQFDGGLASSLDAGKALVDLPCDVETIVAQNCRSCHGVPLSGGAPMPLTQRSHFLSAAPSQRQLTVGVVSVSRMRSATAPMPPGGQLAAADIDLIASWVEAGMPAGQCGVPHGDAPSTDEPAPEAVVCSSGSFWSRGSRGSPAMNPGLACVSCHAAVNAAKGEEEAPEGLGGTVYPTLHEPDLCNGLAGAAVIVIRGADGREERVPVNSVGNFFLSTASMPLLPYTARVEYQGRVRAMGTPQRSGDCNGCHTQHGDNGAPGRIRAP